jgi:dipeptidase D
MGNIKDLQPAALWRYFDDILKIPRKSGSEDKILTYLEEFGKKHKLETKTDKTGNMLISKHATPGNENKKQVCLQSHVDMVCEKNSSVKHNFDTDPIIAKVEEDWVKATGTTLGADNGIGIASQLAILGDKKIKHGPIECLFTVDEEMGLKGAFNIKQNFFTSKILINLDSEDEGELFIGSAGGINTKAIMSTKIKKNPKDHVAYKIEISGLKGGHSGDDIDKGRGNSIKILNRFLWTASKKLKIKLVTFEGGNLPNAIPRESYAVITIPKTNETLLKEHINQFIIAVNNEIKAEEPDLNISLIPVKSPSKILKKGVQYRLLNTLYACPTGVIAMSRTMKGLVETSTNLASVKFNKTNNIVITTSQRSSVESAKDNIANAVSSVFHMGKAEVEHSGGYPGWNPNPDSEILKITKESYKRLFNTNPKVRAIHAGLECGLFLEKYPYLDIISFGPTITGAHSPDEQVNISSALKFWDLLVEVLKSIPEK